MDERRASVAGATSRVKLYVIAILVTAGMAFLTVAFLAIFVAESATAIAAVVGMATLIIQTLLGGGLKGVATSLDGKLAHLVRITGEKEFAEGKIEGLKENPNTNIS